MNTQIEEMAKICCGICEYEHCGECLNDNGCGIGGCFMAKHTADNLYNAGYRKSTDVEREIFEEIELLLDTYSASHHSIGEVCGESYFERGLEDAIAELKKKYESEG